jgi:hypothetical protein
MVTGTSEAKLEAPSFLESLLISISRVLGEIIIFITIASE